MSLVKRRIAAQEIVIAFSVYIPYKNSLAFFKDYRQRMVIMGSIMVFQFEVICCFARHIDS